MRILMPVIIAACLVGCGSEMLLDESNAIPKAEMESSESNMLASTAKNVNSLDGALDLFELKQQFRQLEENGIDTSKEYKWEFRFQGKIMSSLEDFAQTANLYNFWPVALESTVDGGMYWLYIQKNDTYTEEKFIEEISGLFDMARRHSLFRFDGFSIDHIEKTDEGSENSQTTPDNQ